MTHKDPKMVTLRTNEVVPRATVEAFRISLEELYGNPSCPLAFLELVLACRDRNYVPFGTTAETLKELGFVQDIHTSGHVQIHDDVRHVVLAATDGGERDLHLVSPYAH